MACLKLSVYHLKFIYKQFNSCWEQYAYYHNVFYWNLRIWISYSLSSLDMNKVVARQVTYSHASMVIIMSPIVSPIRHVLMNICFQCFTLWNNILVFRIETAQPTKSTPVIWTCLKTVSNNCFGDDFCLLHRARFLPSGFLLYFLSHEYSAKTKLSFRLQEIMVLNQAVLPCDD